jgi:phosphoribosyl 1,2-cyclic phosphodiesterase
MKFEQFYSSSNGNLYLVTAGNGRQLMLECGVRYSRIQKAINYNGKNIEACLLSHEHKDHSFAAKHVMSAGIDIYSGRGTFESLNLLGQRRARIIADKSLIMLDDFEFFAFSLNHDAVEPLGFIIRENLGGYKGRNILTRDRGPEPEHLLFVPDTSHITQRFKVPFNIIAIECSYDRDILQARVDSGEINEQVAKRLLASHMEKQATMRYLSEFCNLSRCRQIHLLHLSGDNSIRQKIKKEFEDRFFVEIVVLSHG